ncbi:MAG: N-methyl-L-tryptophan oxidase [Verrucomicrobia bacterium]|nr:N-methyl-L-tryptophan oxidase [Verrucomicrobiota bacterium]
MSKSWDVIVLGLGGMGSAALRHLARRGRRVLGLDRYHPPHGFGSSHGRTRVIRQCYFEGSAYVPLLLRAYELWRELEQESGARLLELCGGLMMGAPDSEVVSGSLSSARAHGLPHELLDAAAIRRRFPQLSMPESTVALWEPHAGLVFSEHAIAAHLDSARRAGASTLFETVVEEWTASPGGVRVRTARGEFEAEQLIVTPGPWAPDALAGLGLPLQVERQVLYWFQPDRGTDDFVPGRFPVYIWQRDEKVQPYGFPSVDGGEGGVKVSFFRAPETNYCTPDTVDRLVSEAEASRMREVVREYCPALAGRLVHAVVCMYTLTPDLHFIVGQHPAHANVTLAAGFSGHGYKFCSVMGEVLADLALQGRTSFDLALFSPARFPPTPNTACLKEERSP